MPAQDVYRMPAVVSLPGDIDLISREHAYDLLSAAVTSGGQVVTADLSATTFCDGESLRRLVSVRHCAAAQNVELRIVIPPGSPVRRLAELISLDHPIPMYPSLRDALLPDAHAGYGPRPSTTQRHRMFTPGEPPSAA